MHYHHDISKSSTDSSHNIDITWRSCDANTKSGHVIHFQQFGNIALALLDTLMFLSDHFECFFMLTLQSLVLWSLGFGDMWYMVLCYILMVLMPLPTLMYDLTKHNLVKHLPIINKAFSLQGPLYQLILHLSYTFYK